MAFFLEGKRNTDFPTTNHPSPFEYSINPQKKKTNSYAPFNSTTKLNRSVSKPARKQTNNDFQEERAYANQQTNNIPLMVQQRMSSIFKSRSERIVYNPNDIPGPGSYQLRSKYKNSKKNQGYKSNNCSTSEKKINPPSIPTDNLGYRCTDDNKVEKVAQKQPNIPVPGSYELRTDLVKQTGLTWNKNAVLSRKEDDVIPPGPGSYNLIASGHKAPTSCFNSESDRFNPKKIRKQYHPGPGEYNVEDARLYRQYSESHFNSKSVRFAIDKASNVGPGSYIQTNNKSLKGFNKKVLENYAQSGEANRKTIFSIHDKNPGPGEYLAREGMTFELQKALLRKHNLSQFPNTRREVFEPKELDEPGPGAYDPVLPKNSSKGNIGYKKVEVINLKSEETVETPSPLQYTYHNFSMAKKIEKSTKRLTLTDKKPFNSGAQRFQHYDNSARKNPETKRNQTFDTQNQSVDMEQQSNINFEGPKRVKKLIMTSVKVKVPFGASTSKFDQKQLTNVGPGCYNSSDNWIKPSYSIKGKLQAKK